MAHTTLKNKLKKKTKAIRQTTMSVKFKYMAPTGVKVHLMNNHKLNKNVILNLVTKSQQYFTIQV